MGIRSTLRRIGAPETTRSAMRDARDGQADGGAVARLVEMLRDVGIDGRFRFASAESIAARASRHGRRTPDRAVRRIIRKHRRGATAGGFVTGLGGFVTLPLMLPLNIAEFYVQATRMVAAIAAVRGYDLSETEVRTRVLAALVGEESGELLDNLGFGPVRSFATKQVAKRVQMPAMDEVTSAIGVRILQRFGLKSVRLFGKAIPLLGAVVGAWLDRRQIRAIARAAKRDFPPFSTTTGARGEQGARSGFGPREPQ